MTDDKGKVVRAKDLPERYKKSLPWLRGCVERCRGSVFFRTCVARHPETPLTELHLCSPAFVLLLVLGLFYNIFRHLHIFPLLLLLFRKRSFFCSSLFQLRLRHAKCSRSANEIWVGGVDVRLSLIHI